MSAVVLWWCGSSMVHIRSAVGRHKFEETINSRCHFRWLFFLRGRGLAVNRKDGYLIFRRGCIVSRQSLSQRKAKDYEESSKAWFLSTPVKEKSFVRSPLASPAFQRGDPPPYRWRIWGHSEPESTSCLAGVALSEKVTPTKHDIGGYVVMEVALVR